MARLHHILSLTMASSWAEDTLEGSDEGGGGTPNKLLSTVSGAGALRSSPRPDDAAAKALYRSLDFDPFVVVIGAPVDSFAPWAVDDGLVWFANRLLLLSSPAFLFLALSFPLPLPLPSLLPVLQTLPLRPVALLVLPNMAFIN